MLYGAKAHYLFKANGGPGEDPGWENRPFRHVANAQHYQYDRNVNGGALVGTVTVHLTGCFLLSATDQKGRYIAVGLCSKTARRNSRASIKRRGSVEVKGERVLI